VLLDQVVWSQRFRSRGSFYHRVSCIRKFPNFYCCNCLSEIRWEGRPRSHFWKPIAFVCHVRPHCEHTLFIHECFFDFTFHFVSDRWQKSSNVSASKRQKILKNLRTYPRKLSPNNPWANRYRWDQLWSFTGVLNRKCEHAPHCHFIKTTCPPTHPWKPQSLLLTTTWLSFPILPTRRT
jgi:hypothetical protein